MVDYSLSIGAVRVGGMLMNRKMSLWILRAIDEHPTWLAWPDMMFGAVVRAPTEKIARNLASSAAGDEGFDAWQDNTQSTCVELLTNGGTKVLLKDVHWG